MSRSFRKKVLGYKEGTLLQNIIASGFKRKGSFNEEFSCQWNIAKDLKFLGQIVRVFS
jgi:hypothetical protein